MDQTEQQEQGGDEPKGLACFMDQGRICGSDCMSYLPTPPEGKHYIGENWARCHVLVNMERGSRHLVVLADISSKLMGMKAREHRESQKAPGVG